VLGKKWGKNCHLLLALQRRQMPENNHVMAKEDGMVTLTQDELRQIIESAQMASLQEIKTLEQFSGPVPHPDHMQQYKNIDPSLPDRFTAMAEKTLAHNQWVSKTETIVNSIMAFLGWATPTGLSAYILVSAVGFIQEGKSIEALIALVGALATLAGAFYLKAKK